MILQNAIPAWLILNDFPAYFSVERALPFTMGRADLLMPPLPPKQPVLGFLSRLSLSVLLLSSCALRPTFPLPIPSPSFGSPPQVSSQAEGSKPATEERVIKDHPKLSESSFLRVRPRDLNLTRHSRGF